MTRRDFILIARTLRASRATKQVVFSMADAIEDETRGKAGFDRNLFLKNATCTDPKED